MRIVLLTTEEPFHIPVLMGEVVARRRDDIVGIVAVRPLYKKATWLSQARRFISAFGVKTFVIEVFFFGCYKMLDLLSWVIPLDRFYSVKRLARFYQIPFYTPRDINAPDFLDELKKLAPDLIISVSCPQIFKKDLVELPSLGCINIHSALLPKYRGILPTFWVLANNEQETGVTVHYISSRIDEGAIIMQEKVPISPEDTLHSLMRKCKLVGADLLLRTIAEFEKGSVSPIPNRVEEGSYYSFPTKEDVIRFRRLGRKIR